MKRQGQLRALRLSDWRDGALWVPAAKGGRARTSDPLINSLVFNFPDSLPLQRVNRILPGHALSENPPFRRASKIDVPRFFV